MGFSEDRYILWNYMLAEECLLSGSSDGVVQLMVTPRTLARALEDAGEGGWSPDEAEADFVAAVATVYNERVLGSSKKLRALKSVGSKDVPFGTSFLALSVLAAFHMRTDDEHTGRAFYPRLADMLRCELVHSQPAGFEGEAFLELWGELADWLKLHFDRQLASPTAAGVRRYIAYPFAHVPLRQVDIERLPQFFDAYGYEPGIRTSLDRLAYDLVEGAGPWRYLTEAGQRALQDPNRRAFVVRQVGHELQRWDGCRIDSSGARAASIEVWMDIRRRRAHLYLLARRPEGFPDLIEDGELVFESSQEGWYEPIPLGSDDGRLLKEGLRVTAHAADGRYFLQLRSASAIPLTPGEEYTGFVSDRVLHADTHCAVLCAEQIADQVACFLTALTGRSVQPRGDDTIPRGWCLFTDIRPINGRSPPPGLERLCVETSIGLVPEGGLRLGRRWTWLEDAPAQLLVLGSHQGLAVRIDGQQAAVDEDGRVDGTLLRPAGQHIVEIGNRLRQRVTVLSGTVHPDCAAWQNAGDAFLPVALPPGPWTLVGAKPGESEGAWAASEGTLVRPKFRARWAVRVGAGPGATALHLHDDYVPPHITDEQATPAVARRSWRRSRRSRRRWAETIYQAGIRRPQLMCAVGCRPSQLLVEWRAAMRQARSVKREMRSRRK